MNTKQELQELSKGFDVCRTTAWRQLFLLRPKKLFGSGNMGQNNWGGGARPPVPLSDGLDTRPCKILDPRLAFGRTLK